jgi:hypothetical protein
MRRAENITYYVRQMVSVSEKTAKAIDDFRFENHIETEAEAIRRLIEAGLRKLAAKCGNQEDALTPPGAG